MKNLQAIFLSFGVIAASGAFAAGETFHVGPDQAYTTIQSAVDAASSGDVVKVVVGIFEESVVINGKSIQLLGSWATDFSEQVWDMDNWTETSSIIRGSNIERCISWTNCAGGELTGFVTIEGAAEDGAAMYVENSTLLLSA